MFTQANAVTEYALAGKATLTLQSEKTDLHFTFKIERKKGKDNNLFFVTYLAGPNNETDYRYLGILRYVQVLGRWQFQSTKRSPSDSAVFGAFNWFWRHMTERQSIPANLVIRHNGHCGRCGRKLTTPQSIDRGIGPECAKHDSGEVSATDYRRKAPTNNIVPFNGTKYEASAPNWLSR